MMLDLLAQPDDRVLALILALVLAHAVAPFVLARSAKA
jgi:hypothetical protein